MNVSAWAIRNPIAPLLGVALFLVLGWQSFNALPITRFPNIDVPIVAVSVAQAGSSPTELERQVTREIEDAVSALAGVQDVTSTVSDGVSTTAVVFRMEVPTDRAVQDVKDAVDQIRGSLPATIEAPIVTRIDVEGQAIMTFGVKAPDMTMEDLSWFVDDTIVRALQGQRGVGRVDRYGGVTREISIALDPARLNSFGITAASVSQQLRQTNADLGAGRSVLGGGEQAIRTLGDATTVTALADTTIALPSGRFVRLRDLGDVVDTYREPRSFARLDGAEVVVFSVFRAKGASEVSVANTVNAQLDAIRAAHPQVTIVPIDDTVFFTVGNYQAAISTMLEGGLLAVIVVFAFLRNWRATAIATIVLPLSAIPTFWAMDLLGFSLNLVSFLALTLAIGVLVDDAIVEVENFSRHVKMGKTPYRAALDGSAEIGLAVVSTSATIVAVFVPVSFMGGIPGQYFMQFGLTVAIAVIFSLMVTRLITPMMCAYLMRPGDAKDYEGHEGPLARGYNRLVRTTMRARYVTLVAAIGILIVSLHYMAQIPGSFIPPEDASRIPVSVELPPGSSLADTDRTTEAMRRAILDIEGISSVFVLGGSSPTGDRDIRRASFTILLDRLDHSLLLRLSEVGRRIPLVGPLVPEVENRGRIRPQWDIETEVFARLAAIPDVRAFKLNDRGERDIAFSILSRDEAALNEASARLEAALRGEPLLANVAAQGALPRPEVQIVPRADEAARLGVTTAAIAETVRVATIGDFDAALAKLSLDDRMIPVRARVSEDIRGDALALGALRVRTATGGTVPLNAVADITLAEGPSVINRLNRERRATIGANLPPGVALGTATARFNEIVASVELPPGVRIAESGDAEVQAELVQSFGNAMVLGLLLVLVVLILLFGSVIQPLTILLSLPLAIGGVAAALILTNSAVSMPVLIGILMLMGVVTKNAILLIDFAIEMRARGMDRFEAMVDAGRKRARPIVMTSIAMAAGMLPSALGVGEGGSFRAPMATAVIGGILTSTVLSLVIVPSFYLIMDDLSQILGRLFGGLVGARDEEPAPPDPRDLAATLAVAQAEIETLNARLLAVETGAGVPRRHAAE